MKVVWGATGDSGATATGGLIEIHAVETAGALVLTMPGGEGQCRGRYFYSRHTGKGTWGAQCSGDVSAWGDFDAAGLTGGTAAEGQDSKGRTVSFVLRAAD